MNAEIQPFEFENNQVMTLADGDDALSAAPDIAKILECRDAANLTRTIDDDEKGIREVNATRNGMRTMTVLADPDSGIRLLTDLKAGRAKRIEAENQAREPEPKAKALDDPPNMPDVLLARKAAKQLLNETLDN